MKNFKPRIDPALVGNYNAQGIGRLAAHFTLGAHFWMGQTESDIVVRESAAADEDGVAQRALAQKMKLVLARREIDRRKRARRDFAVNCHGKGGSNEGSAAPPYWAYLPNLTRFR